jgi:3-isopropylmalate/(R)-2-methylmalate dehydratase large subunit
MGMTMTQKILAAGAGLNHVEAGQLIEANLDLVLGNDITAPVAIKEMDRFRKPGVFDQDKIALVPDHFVPAKDIKSAENCKCVREFARRNIITNYFEVGQMGIEHALLPEQGLVSPGDVIIGADSHTCTYGALGAFSTGVGSTDMAAGMATGKAWFKVPSAIRFNLHGKLNKWVSGKDVILHIIGMIGVDGALYQSMEFAGEGVSSLSMDDRFTIANMAIEAGGKNGIFPVDDRAKEYLAKHPTRKPDGTLTAQDAGDVYEADPDAEYTAVYDIDLSTIRPTVSFPHLPENAKTFDEIPDIEIQQVVIGSCTNGREQDLEQAAKILTGRHIKEGLRCIVIPATEKIYLTALHEGWLETFIKAGCVVSTPTCGPCLGGYMGILAAGERCVSTTNRNFVGRMGDVTSEIYLASPATAAASAIAGKIADPTVY